MKTEAQFIRERCLGLIRESSMNEGSWEMTILDSMHDGIGSRVSLENEEYPIVSFLAGSDDWTLYTTHRLIGAFDGLAEAIPYADFDRSDFGDFKQDLDSPRVTTAIVSHAKKKTRFRYESGYAAMAPIHYFKFWSLKWPVWQKTYALEMKKPNQSPQIARAFGPRV